LSSWGVGADISICRRVVRSKYGDAKVRYWDSHLCYRFVYHVASTFGSGFVALRVAVKMVKALRYKLRMFGVPLEGPAIAFCDNHSIVLNSTLPFVYTREEAQFCELP